MHASPFVIPQAHAHAQQHPQHLLMLHSAPWYAVLGVTLASLFSLILVSAFGYRCYSRYQARGTHSRLSSAIRNGMSVRAGMPRSPSIRSNKPMPSLPLVQSHPQDAVQPERTSTRTSPIQVPTSYPPGPPVAESSFQEGEGHPMTMIVPPKTPSPDSPLGMLHFSIRFDRAKMSLLVTIRSATDLPAKDPSTFSSDPYVKLQLLPEKRQKVKTRVLRKTTGPVYDETFTFYGMNSVQTKTITLHFVVLSFDRFSRDDVIGELLFPLADLALSEELQNFSRPVQPRAVRPGEQGRGELLVSLCHQPAASRLTVVILKARNLPKMDITGLSDPYVKIYLNQHGKRVGKKKTHVKKRTLNPVFNESFLFDVPAAAAAVSGDGGGDGLGDISLEMQMLDWDRMTKNEVIGRLELGADCNHWLDLQKNPRKQIAEWHRLLE